MSKKYINGTQLTNLISENIAKVLSEVSYNTIASAAEKSNEVDFDAVFDAIRTLNRAISTYDSDSFHTRNRAMSHFFSTGKEPVDSAFEKFDKYLTEMWNFFERKQAQAENLESGVEPAAADMEREILNYLNKAGYQGDNPETIIDNMTYDEFNNFKRSLPYEMAEYVEENM